MITPDWSARTFNEMFLISPEFLTTSMYSTVPTENLADPPWLQFILWCFHGPSASNLYLSRLCKFRNTHLRSHYMIMKPAYRITDYRGYNICLSAQGLIIGQCLGWMAEQHDAGNPSQPAGITKN